ncbi:Ubiquitin-conjugating enzyme E2 S [Pseudolycoriella hygida]|uniref:Ubiquitin-conjugating enzyme E2 S n=1 Tax=Pseudolycoriella hygida TaxID=35572 RepID=A0A9Q0S1H7_9DIPT|nr:Ubiquitin-conjugating enzyme E2 S [Pseudolycoriella hygida]
MNSVSNVENLSPQTIRQVVKEMHEISLNSPEGIKVQINDADVTDIHALIQGPEGTPYAGGVFRVKLQLAKDFPASPPKAFFKTRIFHPNVSSNGEICVNTLKRDWKPDLGIKHILLTIKCLLIVPNAESALNEEAGKMLLDRYDDYSQRAKMMTEIHALPLKTTDVEDSGPLSKKHAIDKKIQEKKKEKLMKEKKRILKRL